VSSSWSYLDPVILPLLVGETVLDADGALGRYDSRLGVTTKRLGIRASLTSLPRRLPAIAETIVAFEHVG
jgi:hypothetical protein